MDKTDLRVPQFVKRGGKYFLKLGSTVFDAPECGYQNRAECREAVRLENEESGRNDRAIFIR
jgi:hypothetical protein